MGSVKGEEEPKERKKKEKEKRKEKGEKKKRKRKKKKKKKRKKKKKKCNQYGRTLAFGITFEPPRGKTNNMVSEQVRHKPACTSTGKS